MHNKKSTLLVILGFVLFTPGCTRIVDWGKDVFDQGEDLDKKAQRAQKFIRSTTVYDQFKTVGMFDALWLSDEVRMIYADIYADRRGKPDDFKKIFLRRQFEENKHFIMFYVLSPFEFPLTDQKAVWSLFLHIDGKRYYPSEIKIVELDVEYKAIFGNKLSRFKESYVVKFDAKDLDENPIVTPNTEKIELVFKSIDKKTALVWHARSLGVHSFSSSELLDHEASI